jgi:hypothetical protein
MPLFTINIEAGNGTFLCEMMAEKYLPTHPPQDENRIYQFDQFYCDPYLGVCCVLYLHRVMLYFHPRMEPSRVLLSVDNVFLRFLPATDHTWFEFNFISKPVLMLVLKCLNSVCNKISGKTKFHFPYSSVEALY